MRSSDVQSLVMLLYHKRWLFLTFQVGAIGKFASKQWTDWWVWGLLSRWGLWLSQHNIFKSSFPHPVKSSQTLHWRILLICLLDWDCDWTSGCCRLKTGAHLRRLRPGKAMSSFIEIANLYFCCNCSFALFHGLELYCLLPWIANWFSDWKTVTAKYLSVHWSAWHPLPRLLGWAHTTFSVLIMTVLNIYLLLRL